MSAFHDVIVKIWDEVENKLEDHSLIMFIWIELNQANYIVDSSSALLYNAQLQSDKARDFLNAITIPIISKS